MTIEANGDAREVEVDAGQRVQRLDRLLHHERFVVVQQFDEFRDVVGAPESTERQRGERRLGGHEDRWKSPWRELAFLGIGFYGGFVQAGVGFFILTLAMLAGLDLVKGNALKVLVVLVFTPLALVVFIASVFVPLMKLAILLFLLVSVHRRSAWRPVERTRLYRITEAIGRWSMVDIYVVTVLVALVIPLSMLWAFISMRLFGFSANLMSLGGLAISIGMVVDGSIVVTSNGDKTVRVFAPAEG